MRLFLDANIIVSGIIFKGNEHDLLLRRNQATFITSEDIIDEIQRTIQQKFPDEIELGNAFLSILRLEIVKRKRYIKKLGTYTLVRDKNDKHVLAAAIETKSDYLISGDQDLLSLKQYKTLPIINARDALLLFTRRS